MSFLCIKNVAKREKEREREKCVELTEILLNTDDGGRDII
jgi:hypothetical protein